MKFDRILNIDLVLSSLFFVFSLIFCQKRKLKRLMSNLEEKILMKAVINSSKYIEKFLAHFFVGSITQQKKFQQYIFFLADIGEKEKTQYTYINTIKSYSKWHYIKWFENFYSAHDYYLRSCSEKAQFHLFNNHLRFAKIYNQGNQKPNNNFQI